ncbi:MAG: metallophosphoesterase [Gemmatimonadota bacterium]
MLKRTTWLLALVPALAAGQQSQPQCTQPTGGDPNRPFPVCDVRAVITRGPYLSAPTDTSATITWMTDVPSHSRVLYGAGALNREQLSVKDGMIPVGTLHSVRLTGLQPGRTYQYRVTATPVLELNTYWPKKGQEVESATYSFTTFDSRKPTTSFVSISDTHESAARIDSIMRRIDWTKTEFLVHTGDAFNGVTSEAQVWDGWLQPLIKGGLSASKPLLFARGNHDTRGPFARELERYVPIEEGRFYYTREIGPVHLIVIDTGEDKHDSTQVYARLNRMKEYRASELAWLREHTRTSARLKQAPFRIVVMHQPSWGWLDDDTTTARAEWSAAANQAGIDLVIAGHRHRYSLTAAGGPAGNTYPILVVGQGQHATVDASETEVRVTVFGNDGNVVGGLTVTRRPRTDTESGSVGRAMSLSGPRNDERQLAR